MIFNRPLRLLFISTAVAPLGSGIGGGVELTLFNLTRELKKRGCSVEVAAPQGSVIDGINITQLPGKLQPKAQKWHRNDQPEQPEDSVLTQMCNYARSNQYQYDLIVNFSYDWLPVYLTRLFDVPIAHFISMSSLNDALDYELSRVSASFESRLACYSRSQAETFPRPDSFAILGGGIDLTQYTFRETTENYITWVGRISREKSIEDTVQSVVKSGYLLKIIGKIEDSDYYNEVTSAFPRETIDYCGFLSTFDMQNILGKSLALIMTPEWVEAFGIVAIEALACGVPVISYNRGGPSEIITNGKTGFLVQPGNIDEITKAIDRISEINRKDCRIYAEQHYSLEAWVDRFESWFQNILTESGEGLQ